MGAINILSHISTFQGHLNIVARALPGTEAAALAKNEIKFIGSAGLGFLYGVVRTIHIAVAAVEAEAANETAAFLRPIIRTGR
jgi:hypothetical protein